MRDAARGISWVTEERLHLTLKFLGEQTEGAVAPLQQALAQVLSLHPPVTLQLEGLGAFPNLRAPRVVWLGVERDPKLELLQHDVERACANLGYELEGRAFRPHITLGRMKERHRLSPRAARALASAARSVTYTGSANVDSLDLMASQLKPDGPQYTVLAAISLRGGGK
jgi:2'-5' RNA ligase